MLKDISIITWIKLLISLLVFLGPGIGLISLLIGKRKFSLYSLIVLSLALSISFWTILLVWCRIFSLNMLYPSVIFLISICGWIIAIREKIHKTLYINIKWEGYIWIGIILSIIINFYSLRHMVAGLGSDSFHHTLIVTLITKNHSIPNNYFPYVDNIITFNYHFGYHAFIAILSILNGIEPRLLVLISGPLLVGLSALSTAYFVAENSVKQIGIVVAAYIPALISVIPTGMLLWGRYPQLLGLCILPILLSEYYRARKLGEKENRFQQIILISFISAGLLFIHYRVTYMAIAAIITLEIISLYQNRMKYLKLENIIPLIFIGVITFLFVSPWLFHVWSNLHKGFAPLGYQANASFYSLSRLGEKIINYPTNIWLILSLLIIGVFSIREQKTIAIWIIIWTFLMLISARYLGKYSLADPVTEIISIYIPFSIIIALGFNHLLNFKYIIPKFILYSSFILLSIYGTINLLGFLDYPNEVYVYPEDIKAANWIKTHTPKDALFMINTYQFDFSPSSIIGADAGGWLPILAERKVITYPMTSAIERFNKPTNFQNIINLYNIQKNIDTQEAIALLKENSINYIYLGQRGGIINAKLMKESRLFRVIYHKNNVYIFSLKE